MTSTTRPSRLQISESKTSTLLDFKAAVLQLNIMWTIAFALCTIILGSLASSLSTIETSYFANKQNLFNTVFVKNGWFWTSLVFWYHVYASKKAARSSAISRWILATVYWILITQWFFGPPIMDRLFTLTGGACKVPDHIGQEHLNEHVTPETSLLVTSFECRNRQGRWDGGHDLSGHIFLLTYSALLLMDEIQLREKHFTCGFNRSEKLVCGLLLLWWWMLLMTSLYFHSFFEKMTGFSSALFGWALLEVLYRMFYLLSMRLSTTVLSPTKSEPQKMTMSTSTLLDSEVNVNSPEPSTSST